MRHLTIDEIFAIHDRAIREYGGSPELLDLGRLEATLAVPRQTMFGEELYPDIFSKAAILFYLLIKNHPFVDGNKRTAFLALMRFLNINGYSLNATNDELYQFTIDVASSVSTKEEVEMWIRDKTEQWG
ncbi:MAG: type II toxin-antitoxin system death-on-curing family toxin [Anaerolineae bacterium]|nr:type II toxin-antitoxin system death-on-curing family toxin [Anaerolineae bacterium]